MHEARKAVFVVAFIGAAILVPAALVRLGFPGTATRVVVPVLILGAVGMRRFIVAEEDQVAELGLGRSLASVVLYAVAILGAAFSAIASFMVLSAGAYLWATIPLAALAAFIGLIFLALRIRRGGASGGG